MKESTELGKLAAFLVNEAPETRITFREESARDIRYSLVVGTEDNELLRKLARAFGCPVWNLPWVSDKRFEASDDWHGRGSVDLRELADELTAIEGEFFDFDITIGDLRASVGRFLPRRFLEQWQKNPPPVLD
jgi:hypothetical protein